MTEPKRGRFEARWGQGVHYLEKDDNNSVLTIDGSFGEGGGQILRTAIALSAITHNTVRIINIRRNRPKPGLAAQHIAGIKAVGMLCSAEVTGLGLGSTEVEFVPGVCKGGSYKLDIGTAGSIPLVLQSCLIVALTAHGPTRFELTGGTDVRFAPPMDYFRFVIKYFLERMGAKIDIVELKRGYYPRGGGFLKLNLTPPESGLSMLDLSQCTGIEKVYGVIHYAKLPDHIPQRMADAAMNEFGKVIKHPELDLSIENERSSYSPGVGITLWAEGKSMRLASSALGERGIPAEDLAISAVRDLADEIHSNATVDIHAADQLLPYMALGGGCYLARTPLSSHTRTNMSIIQNFLGPIFEYEIKDQLVKLSSI